jgi:hypothetical protein
MNKRKRQIYLENAIGFFAWISGLLLALVVGYGLINGPLKVPEFLGGNMASNITGWAIIGTTVLTIVLSFFRE